MSLSDLEKGWKAEASDESPNLRSQQSRQNFGSCAQYDFVEGLGVQRLLRPEINGADDDWEATIID